MTPALIIQSPRTGILNVNNRTNRHVGISMKRWTDPQKMKVLPELNLYHKIIQNTCKYQEKKFSCQDTVYFEVHFELIVHFSEENIVFWMILAIGCKKRVRIYLISKPVWIKYVW